MHCKSRLPDLLRAVDRLFGPDETAIELIRRLDAGYDSADNRATLAAAPGYVVLKGADNALAARLARDVPLQDWLPVAQILASAGSPGAAGIPGAAIPSPAYAAASTYPQPSRIAYPDPPNLHWAIELLLGVWLTLE